MALKADSTNPMDYLNKMLKDNGFEIVLPDDKETEKEEKKEDEKKEEDNK